jgi:hypothetical protein
MRRRLSAAILELENRIDARSGLEDGDASGIVRMLRHARECLARDRVLEGWQEVYDARAAIVGLYPPEVLATSRLALREEARDHLSGGRLRAVENLLGRAPQVMTRERERAEVQAARSIIDGHYQGVNVRALHVRTQLFYLPIVLATILGALLAASGYIDSITVGDGRTSLIGNSDLLLWVYALGALGSLLSLTLGAIQGVTKQNYLSLTEFRVSITRPLIGAASAAAVVGVLETSLLNIGTGDSDTGLVFAAALAAGFSERLLTNAIRAVVPANGGK